jgi:hypothetical protein
MRALFTYRCYEGDDSSDVALRDRSEQVVTIERVMRSPEVDEASIGGPMYRVRFADGFVGDAWSDEINHGPTCEHDFCEWFGPCAIDRQS